ncbi:MAG TPA: Lrp/AsnC ligand binding domain-containing protein, partial [Bacteroidota bacterium]|nr:Lrp/AsnC ligand binding domain-containing protein [Bacteroidota bacterium]
VVTLDSSKHFGTFMEHVNAADDILECHGITGEGTHLLKVRTENTESLEKLLGKVQSWVGVTKTTTSMVLSTSKETVRVKVHKAK